MFHVYEILCMVSEQITNFELMKISTLNKVKYFLSSTVTNRFLTHFNQDFYCCILPQKLNPIAVLAIL